MSRKDTTPKYEVVVCAVCGRTLLRGEQAETFLVAGSRRQVCELCTARAAHQGWIRESASLELGQRPSRRGERRPLHSRLLSRRRRARSVEPGHSEVGPRGDGAAGRPEPENDRHVHAVPTSGELKAVRALDLFNDSEHPRTIAGVARSLGAPVVTVRPLDAHPGVVMIVVAWELCWYRYEVDLADGSGVRLAGQGYELGELAPEEQSRNAAADEHGTLELAAA